MLLCLLTSVFVFSINYVTVGFEKVSVTLSLFKFVAVVAWFMHLIYDKLLLTMAFGTGMIIAFGTYTALLFLLGGDAVAPPEIPGR